MVAAQKIRGTRPAGIYRPAASVRPDFVKVVSGGQTESPAEDDVDEEGADAEDGDLVQNKLDLARAYLDLGDAENVRAILNEVLAEGNAAQREEARQLLEQADSG